MPLKYLDASLSISSKTPKQFYTDDYQALIDRDFSNSNTITTIKEEYPFASGVYRDITVRLIHVVNNETGEKLGDDYRTILFKDLGYPTKVGTYFKFDDNYWITTNTKSDDSLVTTATIKRCNNTLRWIDEYGGIHKVPCSIDYQIKENRDYATAGSATVTPSGIYDIVVQHNTESNTIQPNQCFLIGNPGNWSAIKVVGGGVNNYNNLKTEDNNSGGLIRLTLVQTYENRDADDVVNGIADYYLWQYQINIAEPPTSCDLNEPVQLTATASRNGETVDRDIEWSSSNLLVARVSASGLVTPTGYGQCVITCKLKNNSAVKDTLVITVEENPTQESYVIIIPEQNYVLEGKTQVYSATLYADGDPQADTFVFAVADSLVPTANYLFTVIDGNRFSVKNNRMFFDAPLKINCVTGEHSREFDVILKGAW